MHAHDLRPFEHSHAFADAGAGARSRALLLVTWLTLGTMVAELAAGWWTGSLALLADGWHMGTHAAALGGAALAAHLARRAQGNAAFAFGGWKIEVLAAYTSGLALLGASVWIAVDAIGHLQAPSPVAYREALAVAVIGLVINLLSAWLLSRGARSADAPPAAHGQAHHDHDDTHEREHAHEQGGGRAQGHDHGHLHGHSHVHAHDHNFQAAYLHVLADAMTSVLAIGALAGGWLWGWRWLDPAVALLAAVVIGRWSIDVLRASARGLLDATADDPLRERVRQALESDGDARLADLHVWQVGPQAWSVAASLVADRPMEPTVYRDRLADMTDLRHVTVEVHRCRGPAC